MKTKVPSFIIKLDSNGFITSEHPAFNNTKVRIAAPNESTWSGSQLGSSKASLSGLNGQISVNSINLTPAAVCNYAGEAASSKSDEVGGSSSSNSVENVNGVVDDTSDDTFVVISSKLWDKTIIMTFLNYG